MSTPIELTGQEVFEAPVDRVYRELTDLNALAQTIPDAESCTCIDPTTLHAVVRPGFSFIRGKLKLAIKLAEQISGQFVKHTIEGSGIGLGMQAEADLRLEDMGDNRTRLHWTARVNKRSGLISMVGAGLIQGAMDKTIKDGWEKLRERLA
jgi:carbon monoxide dehydrogenase subunit G